MMAGPQVAPFEPLAIEGEPAANLVDLVHRSVLNEPGRVALQWKPARIRRRSSEGGAEEPIAWRTSSYREMWDWIRDVSLGLQSLGVAPGDAVAILCRTRPEWLVADLSERSLPCTRPVRRRRPSSVSGPKEKVFGRELM